MSMYNLIENSNSYSKTSGSIWQYYRYEPALVEGTVIHIPAANNDNASFKFKPKIAGKTVADATKNFEIMMPLEY